MTGQGMCSFCHTMNDLDAKSCRECGHDAHVARSQCGCINCSPIGRFMLGGLAAQRAVDKLTREKK